jgi:hypothetical protein
MDDDRLLTSGSARERALLAAGLDETPGDKSVRAAAMALGLLPSAPAVVSGAAGIGRLVSAKWLRLAVNIAAPVVVVAGSIVAVESALGPSRSTPGVGPVVSERATPRPSADSAGDALVSPPLPLSPMEPPAEPSARSGLALAAEAARRKVDTFSEQVALIDRARTSAGAGDSAGTLQAVEEYDHRFPRGLLSEEALLLRIEAVAARRGREAASGLARRFLAEYPRSVHADRLRGLLERGSH